MTRINLIYARASNGVIGANGALPWHLPEDLAHFRRQTSGAPVIMGRKTWDSLPPRFRPLPGRENIVVTRQPQWAAHGATRAAGVKEAVALCERQGAMDAWVIGGAQIFQEARSLAARVIVTEIDAEFEGDAFAPVLGAEWRETSREKHEPVNGLAYSFVTLERV